MRKKAICCAAVSLLALDQFIVNSSAAILTWDPTGAATPTGGPGSWNLTATNKVWQNAALNLVQWTDPASANTAVFPAMTSPPATVTLTDNLNVDSISIMGDGYTISTTSNTLNFAAATPPTKILVNAASTGTLAVPITGNSFTKSGAGSLVLTATNTYAGLTAVTGGSVFGTINSFGAGSVALDPVAATPSATFGLNGGSFANNIAVSAAAVGASTLNSVSTTNTTFVTGAVTVGQNLNLAAIAGGTLDLSGKISGAGALIVNTAGPVAVTPLGVNNNFSGGTQVQGGTLYVQRAASATVLGTGSVQVSSGASLQSGNATIEGDLTVASGGDLNLMQVASNAPGNLIVNSATLSGAEYDVQALGTGDGTRTLTSYSQLISNGNVDVTGATLDITTAAYTPRIGDILYIADLTNPASTVTGTFAGLPGGTVFPVSVTGDGTVYFRIDYNADFEGSALTGGNDIAVYVVPEPTSAAAAVGLLATLAARRNRRAN